MNEETERVAFTPKESALLQAMTHCWTNREIATELHVSYYTAKHMVGDLLDKTGCDNRNHLLVWAIQNGYVDLGQPAFPRAAASSGCASADVLLRTSDVRGPID